MKWVGLSLWIALALWAMLDDTHLTPLALFFAVTITAGALLVRKNA